MVSFHQELLFPYCSFWASEIEAFCHPKVWVRCTSKYRQFGGHKTGKIINKKWIFSYLLIIFAWLRFSFAYVLPHKEWECLYFIVKSCLYNLYQNFGTNLTGSMMFVVTAPWRKPVSFVQSQTCTLVVCLRLVKSTHASSKYVLHIPIIANHIQCERVAFKFNTNYSHLIPVLTGVFTSNSSLR